MPNPNIVTITATKRSAVVSQRIVDGGRERFENGTDVLEPGVEQSFIVHEGQCLRVVDAPLPVVDETHTDDQPAAGAAVATTEGEAA